MARSKRHEDPHAPPLAPNLRERILETSERLLATEGLAALSMREVARRAGVTHQAPYHHFADRESILAALVASGYDDLSCRLEAALEDSAAASNRTVMERAGQAYVGFALERPHVFRIMFRPELVDANRFPDVGHAGDRAYAMLERLVKRVQPRVRVLPHATLHWAVVHGVACLLLDGNLEGHMAGVGREALVETVLQLYSRLLIGDAHDR